MKRHIVRSPNKDRIVIEVPDSVSDLFTVVAVTFLTGAGGYTLNQATFARASAPSGIKVVKVLNSTDPTAPQYETVSCNDFSWLAGVVTLRWITGLAENTSYTLTLEVS